jgi:hypothetical protein
MKFKELVSKLHEKNELGTPATTKAYADATPGQGKVGFNPDSAVDGVALANELGQGIKAQITKARSNIDIDSDGDVDAMDKKNDNIPDETPDSKKDTLTLIKNRAAERARTKNEGVSEEVKEGSDWEKNHDEFTTVGDRATPVQIKKIISDLDDAAKRTVAKRGVVNSIFGKQSNGDLARKAASAQALSKNIKRNSNAKPGTTERKELGQHLVYAASLLKSIKEGVSEGKYQMTHPDGSKMKFDAKDDADAKRQAADHDSKTFVKIKEQGVAEGTQSTTWVVHYDYGPHQSNEVKVKASSEDDARAKAVRWAKTHGHSSIMINRASPAEQGVAEAVDHREFASQGKMHPDMSKHMKAGQEIDFYHSKTGDKISGKVIKNTGTAVHIQANKNGKVGGGETHKFDVSKTIQEARDEGEYDYEGEMAISQLKTIVRHSEDLMEMLQPDTNLPEWVQSKITLATDYMQTAHDYMASEMTEAYESNMQDRVLGRITSKEINKVLGPTKNSAQGIEALKKAFKVTDAQAKMMLSRVMQESVEQIDEEYDKNSPAHQAARKTVKGMSGHAKAEYRPDGTVTIHTKTHGNISSTTTVDHHHDAHKLGYNRSESDYKNSSHSANGLTHKTTGSNATGHKIHISASKPQHESFEQIDESEDKTISRLKQLVRFGLMDKSKLPILSRSIKSLEKGQVTNPTERSTLFELLNELIGLVTGDDAMFAKVRMNVQKPENQIRNEESELTKKG